MSSNFITEDIKKRPVNKQKIIKRIGGTILLAILFGVVATLVILVLQPFLQGLITKDNKTSTEGKINLVEDTNDSTPEELLQDYMSQQSALYDEMEGAVTNETVDSPFTDEQIEEIISKVSLDVTSYRQLSVAMAALSRELSRYMVSVTYSSTSIDWLDTVNNEKNSVSGLIYANNNIEAFILTDGKNLKQTDNLEITFNNGVSVVGTIKGTDKNTNLSIISINLSDLPSEMDIQEYVAKLGSSSGIYVGMPVIAVGSPRGISGSMGYGIIDIPKQTYSQIDSNISFLQTNIDGSVNASGAIFNLQGQVIGIITNNIDSSSGQTIISAYGITELKNRVEKMSNGIAINYLGITATDVTNEAMEDNGVPKGAYILSTQMDSPAMKVGILAGDVIYEIDGVSVQNNSDYIAIINQKNVGDTISLNVKRKSQNDYTEITFNLVIEESK